MINISAAYMLRLDMDSSSSWSWWCTSNGGGINNLFWLYNLGYKQACQRCKMCFAYLTFPLIYKTSIISVQMLSPTTKTHCASELWKPKLKWIRRPLNPDRQNMEDVLSICYLSCANQPDRSLIKKCLDQYWSDKIMTWTHAVQTYSLVYWNERSMENF